MAGRILYILKHDPWGIGGGCYVSLMYLTAFRSLFPEHIFDVCICKECMDHQPEAWKRKCNFIPVPPRGTFSRLSSIFNGIMHRHQQVVLRLIENNEYDYCIFDHNNIAGTLCSSLSPKTKSIVINHNYEPEYFKDNTSSWIYKLMFMHHIKATECKAYLNCTYNIFLTKEDEETFKATYGHASGKSACIGIFDLNDRPRLLPHSTTTKNIVVITGSLDNVQNVEGILYFMKELYPLISDRCNIIIAGKNPTRTVRDAIEGHINIELVPNPENMSDIISRGNIFVCPTRLGGGIKVRIADGLRNGLPVIAHSVSARGYGNFVSKGYFYPYETTGDFLNQFNKLEKDMQNKKFTADEIARYFSQNNSFSAGIEKLKNLLCID